MKISLKCGDKKHKHRYDRCAIRIKDHTDCFNGQRCRCGKWNKNYGRLKTKRQKDSK